jgi:hypothetical protein
MKPPAFAQTSTFQRESSYGSLAKIASVGPIQLYRRLRSWHGGKSWGACVHSAAGLHLEARTPDFALTAMVSTDHFRPGLLAQMARATMVGQIDILINCGQLYRSPGGYPGSTHGMPLCCDAMQAEFKLGDTMILDRANGVGMTVRY